MYVYVYFYIYLHTYMCFEKNPHIHKYAYTYIATCTGRSTANDITHTIHSHTQRCAKCDAPFPAAFCVATYFPLSRYVHT